MPSTQRLQDTSTLGTLADAVEGRLQRMNDEQIVSRIWRGDHTVWQQEDGGITNRLGWLRIARRMLGQIDDLRSFAESVSIDNRSHLLLLGMGGSSLAPEVIWTSFGVHVPYVSAHVLDTTHPDAIGSVQESIDLSRTVVIASSKSGTTIETSSLLAHFMQNQRAGHQYIAITDAGSALEKLAASRGFRHEFAGVPDIGGRYSALSPFGVVPAVLAGTDIATLLQRGDAMLRSCDYTVAIENNPGAWLGAVLGEAARSGHDKLTLVLPDEIATLGAWIEQLVAESTGKHGKGIIPIDGEALGPPEIYGNDRLFVAYGDHVGLAALEAASHPIVRLPYDGVDALGAEFARWMFATAIAGYVLQINPFDEPNVQEAKDATAKILGGDGVSVPALPPIDDLLWQTQPGDYLAVQAFLPRTDELDAELQSVRQKLRNRLSVATTLGYGPRYLHSTGQLHKGGPNSGVFIQVVDEPQRDIAIPGRQYTFGMLMRAQADGDVFSLLRHERRVTRVTLDQLREAVR
jgi:glucose-6-phosphate isomerase